MTALPATLAPGDLLAPGYEVVGVLDAGPSFEVLDVWSVERACRCVAKTVRPGTADEDHSRRTVLREGRLLSRLSHPNVVRAYEVLHRPRAGVVLETLTGATLGRVLTEVGRLPPGDVALLGLHLCSATAYLHGRGVLHLDMKPSNVVVAGGMAKVLDLSLARRPGRVAAGVGTDGYLSPEQAMGGDVTVAADVWGIGTVLFESLTGDLPHPETVAGDADDPPVVVDRPAPRLARRRRGVPRAMAELVDGCLALDPAERPSVEALTAGLAAALGIDPRRTGTTAS